MLWSLDRSSQRDGDMTDPSPREAVAMSLLWGLGGATAGFLFSATCAYTVRSLNF